MFDHDDQYDNHEFDDETVDGEWPVAEPSWRSRISNDAPDVDSNRRRGNSIISAGTSFTGTLRSEDPLYIEGSFEGEIIASSDVTVARGAEVKARVQAIRMIVAGRLDGTVACTDRFEAIESGVVTAEVLSPVFIVKEGATINGALKMRLDDDDELEGSDLEDNTEEQ